MAETKSNTDKTKQKKLPSSIQQVYWSRRAAFAGTKAVVEVLTHYVGNNSKVNIKVTNGSGKTIKKVEKKIFGNHLGQEIEIPADTEEQLFAEVELPKHSLKMKSKPLSIFPPVKVSNVKWDKDTANRGEILKLTADVKNFPTGADAMIEIFEHDADGLHDLVTKFPVIVKNEKLEAEWEFQYVDDTDDIPTGEESEKGYQWPEYFFRIVCAGKSADSGLLKFKDWIKIEVKDHKGNLIPNEDYVLHFPDGSEKKGKLDDAGVLRKESLPPGKFRVEFPNLKN